MMHCEDIAQATVPTEFRNVLVEFTVSYLMEQPTNIPNFGVSFFTKMLENQRTKIVRDQEAIDEMRKLCGDYESSTEESMEILEQELVDEGSLVPSLPSVKDMVWRHLDDILNKRSLPSEEDDADSVEEDAVSVHSIVPPVEADEANAENTEP